MKKQKVTGEQGERLMRLIETIGGLSKFSELIGVKYATIHDWVRNGRISMGCVNAVHKAFPWVSLNWLIFGEGEQVCDFSEYREHKEFLLELKKIISKRIDQIEHKNEY